MAMVYGCLQLFSFVLQSLRAKEGSGFRFDGLHDGFEEVDVALEGFAASGGELVGGAGAGAGVVALFFDKFGGGEDAEVGDEIAIAHAQLRLQILKRPLPA